MFDLPSLIEGFGYLGIFIATFAESGVLVGFLFPGDSLLFTAGFLASQGHLNIVIVIVISFLGGLLGDSVGYTFGRHVGPHLFNKKDSFFFHKDHLERAQHFYQRHGGKTIILARFLPFIRTFAPIVAGIGKMNYSSFLSYNLIGAVIWSLGLSLAGYFLGNLIPNIDHYLMPIILGIIAVTSLPGIVHVFRDPTSRRMLLSVFKKKRKL